MVAALSNGDGTFTNWESLLDYSYSYEGPGYLAPSLGDFNGDGKTDVFGYDVGKWFLFFSNGDGRFTARDTGLTNGRYPTAADFNGDGRADLIISSTNNTQRTSNDSWNIYLSYADGSLTYSSSISTFWTRHSVIPGDFNGDGSTDLLVRPTSSYEHYSVHMSNGDGTFTNKGSLYVPGTASPGDFNGDGKTDFMAPNGSSDADWRAWVIHLSQGDGTFVQKQSIYTPFLWLAFAPGGDLNGDGTDEFILRRDSSAWKAFWSDRNGSFTEKTSVEASSQDSGVIGDFNGDGKGDFIRFNSLNDSANIYLSNPVGTPPSDLLTTITNGLGGTTRLTYKPLTASTVYTKDTTAVYPTQDLQNPLYVVAETNASNGIGGQSRMSYKYQGAKTDLRGRGFLGFRVMEMTDAQTGIRTVMTHRQDYPFIGLASVVERLTSGGVRISRTDNTFAARALGGTRYFPYISQTVASSHEINQGGALTTSVTMTHEFDAYGNPSRDTAVYHDGHTQTTVNAYQYDIPNWRVDRLTRREVTRTTPDAQTQTRVTGYSYFPSHGLPMRTTVEPDLPALRLITDYTYDAFGNRASVTEGGPDNGVYVTRRTRMIYDSRGQFPEQVTNALNQTETHDYDPRFGTQTRLTGPNGLTTTWDYDGFGRKILERRADGTETIWSYTLCGSTTNCPGLARYFTLTQSRASVNLTPYAPDLITYFDQLDREIHTHTVGFQGQALFQRAEYDSLGRKQRMSRPYFQGAAEYWTIYDYDILTRVTQEIAPDGGVTRMDYRGLTTIQTNALSQVSTQVKNSQEQLLQVTDAIGGITRYRYDPFGNLIETRDAAANLTVMSYDRRGRKRTMDDPDMGHWEYDYNAFGDITYQKDAMNQEVRMSYDVLGRLKTRIELEGTSTWSYDGTTMGIGKLSQIAGPSYVELLSYDALGRPSQTETRIAGVPYIETQSYDSVGRPDQYTSGGFRVKNLYTALGYLSEVRNAATNTLYWKADSQNAAGQLTQQTFSSGLSTLHRYDSVGRIETISTGVGSNSSVQDSAYWYDRLGNLTVRSDHAQEQHESFVYDELNRLTCAVNKTVTNKTYTYDSIGNLTTKSDVGTYTYGQNTAGPHAVTQTAGTVNGVYTYDANGNLLNGGGRYQTYYSFNNVKRVGKGSTVHSTFLYNPDRQRMRQIAVNGSVTTTTVYVGQRYEQMTEGTVIDSHHYLYAGEQRIGVLVKKNDATSTLRYFHKDHLGSVEVITAGSTGQVLERLSYDPHGKRRNVNRTDDPANTLSSAITSRGFTDHEHLDGVDLIHMNGRVYHPILGRFLSPDPNVQFPDSTQGWNRYSYVDNNPLSYTDPSGFFLDGFFGFFQSFFSGSFSPGNNLIMPTGTALATPGTAPTTPGNTSTTGGMSAPAMLGNQFNQQVTGSNQVSGAGTLPGDSDDVSTGHYYNAQGHMVVTADRNESPSSGLGAGDLADIGIGFVPFSGIPDAFGQFNQGNIALGGILLGLELPVLKQVKGVVNAGEVVAKRAASTARGRSSEAKVLDELGLTKNNEKVSSAEGNAVPDALTDSLSVEVKDAARVTLTKQLRIETQAARDTGRRPILVTGEHTCVSGPCTAAFGSNNIIRRPDLGPQQ